MRLQKIEKKAEHEFHVSWYIILYKMTLGLSEFILGLSILLFRQPLSHMYLAYSTQELSEDPHDLLIHMSESIVPHLFTHNTYLIFYLLLLGFTKIVGSIGLIYKQSWGTDVLVSLTFILLPFQLIRLFLYPSFFDILLIIIGLFIALYLIEFNPKAWVSHMVLLYSAKYYSPIKTYLKTLNLSKR